MASKEYILSHHRRLTADGPTIQQRKLFSIMGNIFLLLLSLLCWVTALHNTGIAAMNDYGLISVLDVRFYVAVAGALILFVINSQAARPNDFWLAVSLLLMIILLHATPTLLYPESRYAWTYKHIGVVEYIQREGHVDPQIDIYFNWPAFFAASAFFVEISGQPDALTISKWMPVFWNCLYCALIFVLFTSLTIDRRRAWVGTMLFCVTNWVGQDYFAPQALAYTCHLALLSICVRWFTQVPSSTRPHCLPARLIAPFCSGRRDDAPARPLHGWRAAGATLGAVLLGVSIVMAHQLTPFLTLISLAVLVGIGRNRLYELPILILIATILWITVVALPYTGEKLSWLLRSIGDVDNVLENLRPLSDQTAGRVFVATMSRVLSVSIWGLALAGAMLRLHSGYRDTLYGLLALMPFGLFALQSYGGELIFRVYFYTLPWMILLVTGVLFPHPWSKGSRLVRYGTGCMLTFYTVLFVCVYYGNERMNYFTPDEIEASQYINEHAPSGSYITSITGNYPRRFTRYEQLEYSPLSDGTNYEDALQITVNTIVADMTKRPYPEAYIVLTRSQREQIHLFSMMSDSFLPELERDLRESSAFEVVYDTPDAVILHLKKEAIP